MFEHRPYRLLSLAVVCLCFALASIVPQTSAQLVNKAAQNPCVNKLTCHECIQTQSCAWCMQPDHGDKPRCFQHSYTNICPEEYIWNPDTEQKFIINRELTRGMNASAAAAGQMGYGGSYESSSSYGSSYSGSYGSAYGSASAGGAAGSAGASGEIVQISPQRVSLKLRINQVHSLHMRYSQAVDYPVDLYYLMDLSKSMEDDKDKLSALGDKLSETMRKITSNFRLGFGSFVDKVLMPYVSTIPKKLEHPCDGCEAPYGYRNHMPLSTNTSTFTSEVKKAAVSGNLDAPEGGFDAIMQAIVCRQQIGWREKARRLLVFSTDAGFHYAGDGKLGGVIAPNDGECHLGSDGMYTHSSIQDYPSISQINHKVKQNTINVIFAVTANQHSVYEKLSKHIEGSSSAILKQDSSNVVDVVKEEYGKITSAIEMKDNATSHVKITYYSSCLNSSLPELPTSKCDDLKVGDVVNFTAQILVTSCPQDPSEWNQIIQIYPVGINESLIIDLEMLCSCPCERPGANGYEVRSPVCNNHGTLMCGICECDGQYYGSRCECSAADVNANKNDWGCRPDNTTQVDCSGRGQCLCGKCYCDKRDNAEERITGQHCECDNFSCERHKGELCSGHGTCECGLCVCNSNWKGPVCDCPSSDDMCMPPKGGKICSGNGDCECGVCKCKTTEEGRYSGKHCEKCPTCSGRCLELKDCVQCQMYKTGPLKDIKDCAANCTKFTPTGVEKVTIDENKDEQLCHFYDEEDCKFTFKYTEVDNKLEVYAQEERDCPPKVFMLGIVLGVIAAIVLVGLAFLLLWKLFTTIHDRREFARFEKERMNAKWESGENPIYKQATSTFKNPMYAGK